MFNANLADQIFNHIVEHPEEWNQSKWSCGTAHCFAGHAAWIANGPFKLDEVGRPRRDGEPIKISAEALDALGLEKLWGRNLQTDHDLFEPGNTLSDIQEIITALKNGDLLPRELRQFEDDLGYEDDCDFDEDTDHDA